MNKTLTSTAASISILVTIILFIVILFSTQMILPTYLFETSDYYVIAVLLEMVPLGIGVFLYLFLTGQKLSDIVIFNKPQAKTNKKNMIWLIILAAAMAVVGRYFISMLQLGWLELLELVGYKVNEIAMPPVDSFAVLCWATLGIAVTPAIFEELIFRGILQKGLLRNSKPKTAIIVSSFMFMLMHLSVENLAYTFTFGCLLGYMAYKSGSIVPSMVFHFVNNGFSVLSLYILEMMGDLDLGAQLTDELANMQTSTIIAMVSMAIGSLILLMAAIWGFSKLSKEPPENPYLKPMKPTSIIMIVLSCCILILVLAVLAIVQNIVPM